MIKIIKTEAQYEDILGEVEALIDLDPIEGSEERDQLDLLSLLVEDYERKHYPIDLPDPIEAIKFRMEQQGLTNRDLIPLIGSRSKVSDVLNGKLTSMVRLCDCQMGHL